MVDAVTYLNNELRKAKRRQQEAALRRITNEFSQREQVEIAFIPLIYTEVAWFFVFGIVNMAKAERIGDLKIFSRFVRDLRKDYTTSKDMRTIGLGFCDHMQASVEQLYDEYDREFSQFYRSCVNLFRSRVKGVQNEDIKANAYMAYQIIEELKRHTKRLDEKIRKRIPTYSGTTVDRRTLALQAILPACWSDVEFTGSKTQNAWSNLDVPEPTLECKTCLGIIRNFVEASDFEVAKGTANELGIFVHPKEGLKQQSDAKK